MVLRESGFIEPNFFICLQAIYPAKKNCTKTSKQLLRKWNGTILLLFEPLDIGMDKQLAGIQTNDEDNPALGLRGIRLSSGKAQNYFSSQLKGILRASFYGNVKVLYPMVSDRLQK